VARRARRVAVGEVILGDKEKAGIIQCTRRA
jgi:hypothetical protein